ncbi:MAG: carbohydrate-binding family 9-like protein [Zavarzinella sp.]
MKKKRLIPAIRLLMCAFVCLWLVMPVYSQTIVAARLESGKHYPCNSTPEKIVIDGKLDDKAWQQVPWSKEFQDIEGDRKPKPTYRTRVKMLWDNEALYIAAELEEPNVWANLKKHDSVIFHDNDFEVFIDPDGDCQNYAELELNAHNTTWDLLLTKPYRASGKAINGWEITGLQTAVHVNGTLNNPTDIDKGWTIEIRWPWASLKEISNQAFPPKKGDHLWINFSRVQWDTVVKDGKTTKIAGKPEHNWVWSPQGVIDMHRPERWGFITFDDHSKVDELCNISSARFYAGFIFNQQFDYRTKHNKYASNFEDLRMGGHQLGELAKTELGFESLFTRGKLTSFINNNYHLRVLPATVKPNKKQLK